MSNALGFETVTDHSQLSALRAAARFSCSECSATIDITIQGLGAEDLAKKARAKGWAANAKAIGKTLCPRHASLRPKNDPDSELKKVAVMTTVTPIKPVEVRRLTPDQKALIRNLLDNNFDEQKGEYIDGMSDKKIGEIVNLPWAYVERLRTEAYGDILTDPEIVALRQTLDAIRKEVEAQQIGLDGTKKKLTEAASRIEKKMMAGKPG